MEIKKYLGYQRPPKIMGKPLDKNRDKYCDFHKENGHNTEGCIALRLLVEKFIRNGKLVHLVGEHRDHPSSSRNIHQSQDYHAQGHHPRDYQPRRYLMSAKCCTFKPLNSHMLIPQRCYLFDFVLVFVFFGFQGFI